MEAYEIGVSLALDGSLAGSLADAERHVRRLNKAIAAQALDVRTIRRAGVRASAAVSADRSSAGYAQRTSGGTPRPIFHQGTQERASPLAVADIAPGANAARRPQSPPHDVQPGGQAFVLARQAAGTVTSPGLAPDLLAAMQKLGALAQSFRPPGGAPGKTMANGTVHDAGPQNAVARQAEGSGQQGQQRSASAFSHLTRLGQEVTQGRKGGQQETSQRAAMLQAPPYTRALLAQAGQYERLADAAGSLASARGTGEQAAASSGTLPFPETYLPATLPHAPAASLAAGTTPYPGAEPDYAGARALQAAPQTAMPKSAPAAGDRGQMQQIQGDVYLDGALVGRWISRYLNDQSNRANAGPTGYDSRRGQVLPGVVLA